MEKAIKLSFQINLASDKEHECDHRWLFDFFSSYTYERESIRNVRIEM